ncbi:MAG: response regulator [Smithella sp.]
MPLKRLAFILMADDDPDDCLLVRDAFLEFNIGAKIEFAQDGQELIDRLKQPFHRDRSQCSFPDLILLDLNMPRKSGLEALKEIRSDSVLKALPVIVFTTCKDQETIIQSYGFGANAFLSKPTTFGRLRDMVKMVFEFWNSVAELPQLCHMPTR